MVVCPIADPFGVQVSNHTLRIGRVQETLMSKEPLSQRRRKAGITFLMLTFIPVIAMGFGALLLSEDMSFGWTLLVLGAAVATVFMVLGYGILKNIVACVWIGMGLAVAYGGATRSWPCPKGSPKGPLPSHASAGLHRPLALWAGPRHGARGANRHHRRVTRHGTQEHRPYQAAYR